MSESRPLGEKVQVLNGFAFPSSAFTTEEGLPLVRIRDIASGKTEINFRGKFDPVYLLKNGDVLIGMDGDFLVSRWTGGDALLNQRVCKVTSKSSDIDQAFLFWFLQPHIDEIHRKTPQTTVRHLSTKDVNAIPAPDFSGSQQSKIAEVLDTLDAAIRGTEAVVAKLRAMKQGLLHDLLTRGIDTNGDLRPPQSEAPHLYHQTPLGWLPKKWEVSTLDDLCASIVDCPHTTPNFTQEGVYVARTMHIKEGKFLSSMASYVTEEEYAKRIDRLEPMPGDVIFTREAPVGQAFCIPEGMKICLGQRVMLLRPKQSKLNAKYLVAHIYSGAVQSSIQLKTAGTTNPHMNVADVRKLRLPAPSVEEQSQIASCLNDIEARLEEETALLDKLRLQKSGLMDDLLTGRVPVTPLL